MDLQTDSTASTGAPPLVHVVDDDENMRDALSDLLASVDLECRAYTSTEELLSAPLPERPSCLILDVRLPGDSGLDLQAQLAGRGRHLPIIFITGHGDVETCARAMKRGALEFLTKPFRDQDMLDAIASALSKDRAWRAQEARIAGIVRLAASLTRRETEVMGFVVEGLANKQIAAKMGITEVTVKLHRGNVMHKMEATSLADLVRKAGSLPGSEGSAFPAKSSTSV
jgi:FixJ family two-component response regulator